MIDKKELRIGNLVNVQIGYDEGYYDICEVTGITHESIHHTLPSGGGTSNSRDNVYPIQLTAEWLENFGFESSLHRMAGERWIIPIMPSAKRYLQMLPMAISFIVGVYEPGNEVALTDIRYVHDLQNLYYTIRGRELELKNH